MRSIQVDSVLLYGDGHAAWSAKKRFDVLFFNGSVELSTFSWVIKSSNFALKMFIEHELAQSRNCGYESLGKIEMGGNRSLLSFSSL